MGMFFGDEALFNTQSKGERFLRGVGRGLEFGIGAASEFERNRLARDVLEQRKAEAAQQAESDAAQREIDIARFGLVREPDRTVQLPAAGGATERPFDPEQALSSFREAAGRGLAPEGVDRSRPGGFTTLEARPGDPGFGMSPSEQEASGLIRPIPAAGPFRPSENIRLLGERPSVTEGVTHPTRIRQTGGLVQAPVQPGVDPEREATSFIVNELLQGRTDPETGEQLDPGEVLKQVAAGLDPSLRGVAASEDVARILRHLDPTQPGSRAALRKLDAQPIIDALKAKGTDDALAMARLAEAEPDFVSRLPSTFIDVIIGDNSLERWALQAAAQQWSFWGLAPQSTRDKFGIPNSFQGLAEKLFNEGQGFLEKVQTSPDPDEPPPLLRRP